ncbi:hypothetical protein [Listeria fleischmannii]|uniref:hypothetical protein n=1 Tax=Listeria fleischmannii TaxID=1069827 RepID=UPI0020B6F269|nr:hypothetical protein [Listeria fleischmannii]
MSDLAQSILRQNVFKKKIFGLETELNVIEKMMHHIEKHTDIHDYAALKTGLMDILTATPEKNQENSKKENITLLIYSQKKISYIVIRFVIIKRPFA